MRINDRVTAIAARIAEHRGVGSRHILDSKALIERAKTLKGDHRVARIEEIRMMAFAALHGVQGPFDAWHYYAELKKLRRNPPSILFNEALVATCVFGQLRPSGTVRALGTLRAQREEQGQLQEFLAFEALLGDRIPTNHGYSGQTFDTMDHSRIWGAVGGHIEALGRMGYRCFLNSGTLLGVVRDGKLIDHDDDVDLALILQADNEADAAEEWRQLWARLGELGLDGAGGLKSPGIYKLKGQDGCEIDLFPAWVKEGRMYIYPHTYGELSADEVLPLASCKVSGRPMPAEPEKMLAVNYGPEWRQPDPYFKFPWSRAKVRFHNFLEAVA
ncbi:LPS biosynthesis protein [Thalassovita autumnalis]|uniref:LPS biosynthesis protein n=1 Tax=Thalassovita autumnalis TaxID=2072972 RepID=A0A0P1F8P3_9RHOB|nr:LPS biosynthesis protein [Thalassovita autumnalis]CUH74349.1 LPS biosynthesis protein [Thalassovita autumnalis]